MKTFKKPKTHTNNPAVPCEQDAELAEETHRACSEALDNGLVRELIVKDMNIASLLKIGSVDAAFAATVRDKRVQQAIIFAKDMAYLYMLRNVEGIVRQLCFCRPLECADLQVYGMTALHHLMLRPHDQAPRDDDICVGASVVFIEQGGVAMMLESTTMHRTCVPLQLLCCCIMKSLLKLTIHAEMIVTALRSFTRAGGIDIVIAAMISYPKEFELQREGLLLLARLLDYRDDASTQWSQMQMGWAVALTLQNLQEYAHSRENTTSGIMVLRRALVCRSKMSQWTPNRSYVSPKPGSDAALTQLMASDSLQIIIRALKGISADEGDDRGHADDFAIVVLPFYETLRGVQQIIQSGCIPFILTKLDAGHDVDNKIQLFYILSRWSSNPQLGIEFVNNSVHRRCVHWAYTLPTQSLLQCYVCEIICNLSSNTALIENLVAAGAVPLLVSNIDNATRTQKSEIIALICKALRNIAVFEASCSSDEHWILDSGGLSVLEQVRCNGFVNVIVCNETHEHLTEARQFCDMAIEALGRIPSYRKIMKARRLIPSTPETSMFSKAFSALGL